MTPDFEPDLEPSIRTCDWCCKSQHALKLKEVVGSYDTSLCQKCFSTDSSMILHKRYENKSTDTVSSPIGDCACACDITECSNGCSCRIGHDGFHRCYSCLGVSTEVNQKDIVSSPAHYTTGKHEVIDIIEDWGLDQDHYLACVIKYVARAGKKDPDKFIEDLKKAVWYLDRRINKEETNE